MPCQSWNGSLCPLLLLRKLCIHTQLPSSSICNAFLVQQIFALYLPLDFPPHLWMCFPPPPFWSISHFVFVRFLGFFLLTVFSVAISLCEEKTILSKNNFHFLLPRASAGAGAGNVNLPNVSILRIYHLCIVKKKIRMALISSQDF